MLTDDRLAFLIDVLESFCVPQDVAILAIEQAWKIGQECPEVMADNVDLGADLAT